MRFLLVLPFLAIVVGCSPGREAVEEAVKKNLARPKYVEFEDFKYYDNDTVCGRYMGLDHMGDLHGFRPFIYTPNLVDIKPKRTDLYIFCSNQQAVRVNEKHGFSIAKEDVPTYIKIAEDFETLEKAISAYIDTHRALPSSLDALVTSATDSTQTVAPEALQAASLDPWGNAYQYEGNGWAGVALNYKLCTHGANGESGGTNSDTDICKPDLRYFSILLNL